MKRASPPAGDLIGSAVASLVNGATLVRWCQGHRIDFLFFLGAPAGRQETDEFFKTFIAYDVVEKSLPASPSHSSVRGRARPQAGSKFREGSQENFRANRSVCVCACIFIRA